MTFGEYLSGLISEHGWSHYQVAARAKIPRPTIWALANDKRKPNQKQCFQLSKTFGIPIEQFYSAAGFEPYLSEVKRETPEEILEKLKLVQPISVPVYREFHAGLAREEPVEYIYRERGRSAGKNIEAYRITGRCMEPVINSGDIVVVDRDLHGEVGDIILCLVDDELSIGYLREKSGELIAENKEISVKLATCQAAAVVIEVIKRLK